MPPVVCLTLADGRSMVAGCDGFTPEMLDMILSDRATVVTLTGEDSVTHILPQEIGRFIFVDASNPVPSNASVYYFMTV